MSRRKQEINIYSIADEAGVSIATVSRVINRRAGVSESTRSRINALLQRYDFSPDYPDVRIARIALIVPWDDISDYFRRAIKGACRYAHANNLEINIIIKSGRSEGSMLERVRDQQCSGVIVALGEEFKTARQELAATELPCVFLDTVIDDPRLGYIDNDSYTGSAMAVRELLRLGHRNIAYLRYNEDGNYNHDQRFYGYLDTMRETGIEPKPEWIQTITYTGATNEERRLMEQLLHQAPEITAVMAVDDKVAIGAMTAVHHAGLSIPGDISVVGFDNMSGTENWYPALTTVEHPIEEAGFMAAQNIAERMRNPSGTTITRVTLPTKLILRESIAPPRKRNISLTQGS
ncbi:MAG: LacI family DNA-binding transcriptional regulator [Victivallales bacterium]|nr:LacI family DNA-binding transcriptional regulator [Victivallales bacterium]